MSTTIPDQPTDARARLLSHFNNAHLETSGQNGQKWDSLWKENFLPWDKGFPNPALVDLLAERSDLLPRKREDGRRRRALVPGCGKGYDVLLLAACGYDAYGLEISETALEAARVVEREFRDGKEEGVYAVREGVERGDVRWLNGDFFEDGFLKDVEGEWKFDLIYDYTFLSALPPTLRPAWSKRFVELLAPEGRVVCIEFPTYKPPSTGGPPWALPPKIYMAHLPRPGQVLPYAEDGSLEDSNLGEPSENGLKRIEHFQPKRTHQIGYNAEGEVTDCVGIWAHPSGSS